MQLVKSSPMSPRAFAEIFSTLAMQLRATDADEFTVRSYQEALGGYPLEAVRTAAEAFAREPGRKWLPTTGEWTEAIQGAIAGSLRAAVSAREQPWRVECDRCEDTGWVLGLECDGGDRCGRVNPHAPHGFTRACPCRATNRTYLRSLKFGKGAA